MCKKGKELFPSFFKEYNLSEEKKKKLLVYLGRAVREAIFNHPFNHFPLRRKNNAND